MFDQLNSIADLERIIAAGFREGETLEYKRATRPIRDKALVDVAISVSAFANASGGTIIWGVAPDEADRTRAKSIEPIAPENVENILQAIATHVRRPIAGIRHKVLEREGRPIVLVVDVPASPDAPHQVISDWRYYRRNGVRKEPMAHDLVELYFGRRLGPRVAVSYELSYTGEEAWEIGMLKPLEMKILVDNVGGRSLKHLLVQTHTGDAPWFHFHRVEPHAAVRTNVHSDGVRVCTLQDPFGTLHPTLQIAISLQFSCAKAWVLQSEGMIAAVSVFADDMRPVKETVGLTLDEGGQPQVRVLRRDGESP